jgi:hypothetical protein
MKRILFAAFTLLAASGAAPFDVASRLAPDLAAMRAFAARTGERLWPGYGTAPFGFLLISPSGETLLCHPDRPDGFTSGPKEPHTGCSSAVRPRSSLPDALLAAMPLFGEPSTIVMGTPEATGRSPDAWRLTILHEHFHQWQSALPDYYSRVDALDLMGDDKTGMWMLNFAFPYTDEKVGQAYASSSRALAEAIEARGTPGFRSALDRFLAARQAFAQASGEQNWRYLEFQLWQEGVARWTEIELGKQHSDAGVRQEAQALEQRTFAALRQPELARQRRELAYSYGAAEAVLLAACGDGWRRSYPSHLSLKPLFENAKAECGGGALQH